MSQTPPDPHQNENNGSIKYNDGYSSDSSFHQDNYSSNDFNSTPSPSSESDGYQEHTRKRVGRPPKKNKEKKYAPNPQTIFSPDNIRTTSPTILQQQMVDNDKMNKMPINPYQMPLIPNAPHVPLQMSHISGDGTNSNVNSSNISMPGIHPIIPMSTSNTSLMPPIMYPNNNISMNQMKTQAFTAIKQQVSNLDIDLLDLLLKLFEIPNLGLNKNQKVESFTSFITQTMLMAPQNFTDFVFFLLQQLSNKANSMLYPQFTSPHFPIIFSQSVDKKVIYKFIPLNNKIVEIPTNNSIDSEYAIIANIIPQNPQANTVPLIVNTQQVFPFTFGEANDKYFYLISPLSKNPKPTISVHLNQSFFQSFSWIAFYYVLPTPMASIERYCGISQPFLGVRTVKCKESCLFNFYDVIQKFYNYGYSICPNCRQKIFLTKLIPIKQNLKSNSSSDLLSSAFSYHYESNVISTYNYFKREIKEIELIDNIDEDHDEEFDPDKFIEELENDVFNAANNSK